MHTTKTQMSKSDYIRTKNSFTMRHHRVKREAISWKKIFVTHISNKGFISGIYEEWL